MHINPIMGSNIAIVETAQNQNYPIKSIHDIIAVNELKAELSKRMEKDETQKWTDWVLGFCTRMNVEPSRLPINQNFPGYLTDSENTELYLSVLDTII